MSPFFTSVSSPSWLPGSAQTFGWWVPRATRPSGCSRCWGPFESGEGDGADPAGCPGARWGLALLWEEGRSSVSPALEPREGHWPGEAGGAGD